jgi:hypothetical protein
MLASLLLAVFLPMVIATMVHTHDTAPISGQDELCVECVKHMPHATHFSTHLEKMEQQCLFCHFLSLQFLVAAITIFVSYKTRLTLISATLCQALPATSSGIDNTRAPPAWLKTFLFS